jgi:ribosomal protein S18 acetylase RimI-like enzyme
LDWLKDKIENDPRSVAHAVVGDQTVGQLELGLLRGDATYGYVNLYYLAPEFRGKGFGKQLDEYAMSYFKSLGLSRARLSVSPTNRHAFEFYKKIGWKDLGPREGHPEVHFMEKNF